MYRSLEGTLGNERRRPEAWLAVKGCGLEVRQTLRKGSEGC